MEVSVDLLSVAQKKTQGAEGAGGEGRSQICPGLGLAVDDRRLGKLRRPSLKAHLLGPINKSEGYCQGGLDGCGDRSLEAAAAGSRVWRFAEP